jgi:hypothetical protein
MRFGAVWACLILLIFACSRTPEVQTVSKPMDAAQKDEQYKREMDEIRKNLKGDIKIKLKKDGKAGAYNWEIDGKDVHEVLRTNDVIARKLGTQ